MQAVKKAATASLLLFHEGEAGVGFEPTNDGFANRCLRPLGYPALGLVAGAVYTSQGLQSREN